LNQKNELDDIQIGDTNVEQLDERQLAWELITEKQSH
jgi:hypothetical protein